MPPAPTVNTCAGTKIYYALCPHVQKIKTYACALAGPSGNHSFCGLSKSSHPRCVECQFAHSALARTEIAELEDIVEKGEAELKEAKTALEERDAAIKKGEADLKEAKTALKERDAEIKKLRAKLLETEEAAKNVKVIEVEVKCQAHGYAPCASKRMAAQDAVLKDVPSPTSSTSSYFDTVLIRDASTDEFSSGYSTSTSPSPIFNNKTSSIPSKLPILEVSQPTTPTVDAHGRSKRQRTSVSTYNVKVLAGTAIHTPQKFNKGPAVRETRKRKRSSSGEVLRVI